MTQPWVVLDLETEGLDPTRHQILEIAAMSDCEMNLESLRYFRSANGLLR